MFSVNLFFLLLILASFFYFQFNWIIFASHTSLVVFKQEILHSCLCEVLCPLLLFTLATMEDYF